MSLYSAFDRRNFFSELDEPLDTQEGVLDSATQRARCIANLFGDSAASEAEIGGVGTAAAPYDIGSDAADAFAFKVTAANTSGTSRAGLFEITLTGAAGLATGVKGKVLVSNVAAGAVAGVSGEASISGASGSSTGAAGGKFTLTIAAASTTPIGPLAVIHLSSAVATGVTLPAGNTTAFIRVTNDDSVVIPALLNLPNVASAGILAAHTTQTLSHSIRIRSADGTPYYIMCTSSSANRTGGA